MLVVLGTRAAGSPLTAVPGTAASTPCSSRSRSAAMRGAAAAASARRVVGGRAHAGDGRHVLGAGAAVALLAPAGHERHQPHAAADPQRADALGPAELVRRDRQQVDAERGDVDRNLAGGLHGVGVEQRAAGAGQRGQRGHRLQRADLVVGVHDRYEGRAIGQQRRAGPRDRRRRRCPRAARVTSNPRLASALAVCSTASCSMRGDDQMTPARWLERLDGAAHGGVVAFGAAGREDHFGGLGADAAPPPRPGPRRAPPWPAGRSGARSTRCPTCRAPPP